MYTYRIMTVAPSAVASTPGDEQRETTAARPRRVPAPPVIDSVLGTLRAFAIPMPTRFRGTTVREERSFRGRRGGRVLPVPRVRTARIGALAGQRPGIAWRRWWSSANHPVNVSCPLWDRNGRGRSCSCRAALTPRSRSRSAVSPGRMTSSGPPRCGTRSDPAGRSGFDANGGWSVPSARRMLTDSRHGLEYAEQPCATLDELPEIRRHVDIQGAADESIRRAEDPLRVRRRARPTSWCSRCSRSAASVRRCGSRRRAGCPSWCRARSTGRWAWPPGWRWWGRC